MTRMFREKVDELLYVDGKPKPGVSEDDLRSLGLLSAIIGEHLGLRNEHVETAIDKFGPPQAIHAVRQNNIFRITIPIILDWTEETAGETVWHSDRSTLLMKCYEYSDLYLWTGGGLVFAASPRSPRLDKYVNLVTAQSPIPAPDIAPAFSSYSASEGMMEFQAFSVCTDIRKGLQLCSSDGPGKEYATFEFIITSPLKYKYCRLDIGYSSIRTKEVHISPFALYNFVAKPERMADILGGPNIIWFFADENDIHNMAIFDADPKEWKCWYDKYYISAAEEFHRSYSGYNDQSTPH